MSRKVPECSLAFIVLNKGATAAADNGKTWIMGLLKGAEHSMAACGSNFGAGELINSDFLLPWSLQCPCAVSPCPNIAFICCCAELWAWLYPPCQATQIPTLWKTGILQKYPKISRHESKFQGFVGVTILVSPPQLLWLCWTHPFWSPLTCCNSGRTHFLPKHTFPRQLGFFSPSSRHRRSLGWGQRGGNGRWGSRDGPAGDENSAGSAPGLSLRWKGGVIHNILVFQDVEQSTDWNWCWAIPKTPWTIPKTTCETPAWTSFIWGDPAACPAVSTLQSSQLRKVLGVPLKFQGNANFWWGKRDFTGI